MKLRVVVVVVTYNRKDLVLECIKAILNQSYRVEKIILIDNCSTDGTENVLKSKGYLDCPQICYTRMDSNIGGSGGFYEGMVKAAQYQYDWIWVMDDDTIPAYDCLEELIKANEIVESSMSIKGLECTVRPSFFASAVYGINGEFMNVPAVNRKKAPNGYTYWYNFLDQGLINIETATFVSVLIRKEAVEKCGLPCKDFFIWGDDSEYTTRLTKYYGDAYLVGKSVAIHKRASANPIEIKTEMNPQRIEMLHYKYRNTVIGFRYYTPGYYALGYILMSMLECIQCIGKKFGAKKVKAILKGNWEGITQYKRFKCYIDSQIKKDN
ncbi:MAG: glycosyltransferase family 2 protein [Lachnospiraceae bacterium]|nr:glycosyltransferase family 2 protein [Lachnospiraceae bacterium]